MLNSGGSLLIGSGDKKKFYIAAATAAKNGRRLLAKDVLVAILARDFRDTPAFQPFHWPLMSNDSPTWVDVKITSAQLDEEQLNIR